MHKAAYFIIIYLLLLQSCISSKPSKNGGVISNPISIELKNEIQIIDLNKSKGVIFPKEYEVKFNRERLKNRYTPTVEEIRDAEIEIQKQYLDSDRRFNHNQVYNRTEEIYGNQTINKKQTFENLMKPALKEARRSQEFDRQYIGFIEDGKKILLIQFLDFSTDPEDLKNHLTSEFISGWHGWFETNTRLKEYNTKSKRLNSFGWSHLK